MIDIDRFTEITSEEIDLLPERIFDGLTGGVCIEEKFLYHPKSRHEEGRPLYILGTYDVSNLGSQIHLYYGSFEKVYWYMNEDTLRLKIRGVLRHELRHHMETMGGVFGKDSLLAEDEEDIAAFEEE